MLMQNPMPHEYPQDHGHPAFNFAQFAVDSFPLSGYGSSLHMIGGANWEGPASTALYAVRQHATDSNWGAGSPYVSAGFRRYLAANNSFTISADFMLAHQVGGEPYLVRSIAVAPTDTLHPPITRLPLESLRHAGRIQLLYDDVVRYAQRPAEQEPPLFFAGISSSVFHALAGAARRRVIGDLQSGSPQAGELSQKSPNLYNHAADKLRALGWLMSGSVTEIPPDGAHIFRGA